MHRRRGPWPAWITLVVVLATPACEPTHDTPLPTQASPAPAEPQPGPATVAAPTANPAAPAPSLPAPIPQVSHSMNRFPADFGAHRAVQWRGGRPVVLLPPARGHGAAQSGKRQALQGGASAGLLVLYDTSSDYGWLGELYAICARTLASRLGPVATKPVGQYLPGELSTYDGAIYIGSSFDEPIPVAFLDDVLADTTPVLWTSANVWQLIDHAADFQTSHGFDVTWFDLSPVSEVIYKGTSLERDASNAAGLVDVAIADAKVVQTLATAVRTDGSTLPWAVRAKKLTYVAEIPFSFIGQDDRYLAWCDLLFDTFAPKTPVRHRALLRLEDVNPTQEPLAFRAMVDFLYAEKVPFSIALIPLYVDGLGSLNNGVPQTVHWKDRPAMQAAIKYATLRGGTVIMHGYTHQLGTLKNPYSSVTSDDFEFFLTHIDAKDNVVYDGAVPGDSAEWAASRVQAGLAELQAAGFPVPTIFEYPHYAGSAVDSKAIRAIIGTAYHAGIFFGGDLGLTAPNPAHTVSLFYPFKVQDVYGWTVIPENLGNYEPAAYNNHPPRLAKDLIQSAKSNLVVRDGVASFFFHPYYPLAELKAIVAGIKAAGYTFVSAQAL